MTTRSLEGSDVEALRTAALANLNWSGEERFTYRDLDEDSRLRHYVELRLARGDFGVVAEKDGLVVGVVWLLFLDGNDPGFGFVADGVPELCISVWSGYRGEGVGRLLMRAALEEARRRGVQRVSLSVETGDPALRLYLQCGFEPAPGAAEGTYVLIL